MKKVFSFVMACLIAGLFASCGNKAQTQDVDIDLTKLSSTLVYSEVYNMMVSPDQYLGRTVRMKGQFAVYEDPQSNSVYFACVIDDATACCSQGLEFVLEDSYTYPDDYPSLGTEISVTGEFQTYMEDSNLYCHLIHATLE